MTTDKRKHWNGLVGIGATVCAIGAGVSVYSAGPAAAACSTLHVRDDAQILDANAMQNAGNACPSVPALAWTTNKDAGNESAFDAAVQGMVSPAYPMVIGHNAQSNYTAVKIDPNAAGITQDQANAAASYASTTFNSTYGGNQSNSTNAMLAAVRGLNSSIAADHGQSGMVAPAPGTNNGANGGTGNLQNGAPQNGANLNPVPMGPPSAPNAPAPSLNAPAPAPPLNNQQPNVPQVPSVAPPSVPAPATHHSGWRIFWWIFIPLAVLALLGLLWRWLVVRNRRRHAPRPATTYTRPTAQAATPAPPVRKETPRATTPPITPVTTDPRPTAPMPPVREQVQPDVTRVSPAGESEPTIGGHGDDLVTYEVREADGSRQELHYNDRDTGRTGGEWVDSHGVNEQDVNQSWWKPGVKDTGDR